MTGNIKLENLQNAQARISKILQQHPKDQEVIDLVVLEWDPDEKRFNNSDSQIKNIMDIAANFMQEHGNNSEYQMNQSMDYIKTNLSEKQIKPIVQIMWPIGEQMPGFYAHDKDEDLKNEDAMAIYNICMGLVGHDDNCRLAAEGQIIIKAVYMLDILVKMVLDMGGTPNSTDNTSITSGSIIL